MIPKTCKSKPKLTLIVISFIFFLYLFGAFTHLQEEDYYTAFHYPYEGNIEQSIKQLKSHQTPDITPINAYNYTFISHLPHKCDSEDPIRLVYIVKSAPDHFNQRLAIRNSWGFERRFSDVEIRTVFMLGTREEDAVLQRQIVFESEKLNDIVQSEFEDTYFNNTIKTMMAFKWAMNYCPNARYYIFVDDDYYLSTKNVLRFVRNPTEYPAYLQRPVYTLRRNDADRMRRQAIDFDLPEDVRLYAGFVFFSAPHRHITSKWQVSLEEYPYHMWPPYVTAGAFILSRHALHDLFYVSFYTKHFRFDDIYVGLLAKKAGIEPYHSDEFYFEKKPYTKDNYRFVVASHGFKDPEELVRVWTEQKSAGNA